MPYTAKLITPKPALDKKILILSLVYFKPMLSALILNQKLKRKPQSIDYIILR